MTITLTLNGITEKQADDIADELMVYLRDEMNLLVDDYTVEA